MWISNSLLSLEIWDNVILNIYWYKIKIEKLVRKWFYSVDLDDDEERER